MRIATPMGLCRSKCLGEAGGKNIWKRKLRMRCLMDICLIRPFLIVAENGKPKMGFRFPRRPAPSLWAYFLPKPKTNFRFSLFVAAETRKQWVVFKFPDDLPKTRKKKGKHNKVNDHGTIAATRVTCDGQIEGIQLLRSLEIRPTSVVSWSRSVTPVKINYVAHSACISRPFFILCSEDVE